MTRVFLIGGAGSIRERWENLLDSEDVSVIGRAEDLASYDEELADEADVVLVDASGSSVDEWVSSLQEERVLREAKVVVVAEQAPVAAVNRALQAGVRGIIPAELEPEQFTAALDAVSRGLIVLHPSEVASTRSARVPAADFAEAVEALTPRERDVLQMLAQGLGNKEIATRLGISEHTAKFHVASILGKLGASTRTEAVSIAMRRGLILL